MTRHSFCGDMASWVMDTGTATTSASGLPGDFMVAIGSQEVTFWNAATGGSQYTDLIDANGNPVTSVTSGADGSLPQVSGPDGVNVMWADASGGAGPRRVAIATDLGAQADAIQAQCPDWTAARTFGVEADGQYVSDGAITTGTATLTSATASWQPEDAGKRVIVYGAGTGGGHLGASILTVNSTTSVTISASASTTVSGAIVVWATDDTASMQAANAAAAAGHTIYLPAGIIIMTGGFGSLTCQRITGAGPGQYSNQAFTSTEAAGTTIVCDPSNTFSLFGSTSPGFNEVDHLAVIWTAAGGKIFATEGDSNAVIHDCHFEVNDPGGNGQVTASFAETPFGTWERCNFVQTSSTRQLPLYQSITSSSGAEANITFNSCQFLNVNTDNSQYMVDVEFTGSNTGGDGYSMQLALRDCTFGRAWGGAIRMLGVINPVIDNCGFWDLNDSGHPSTGNHTLYFGAGSGGSPCRGVRITSPFKNRTWANGTSLWDVYCESTTVGVRIDGFTSKPDSNTSGANVYLNFNGCADVVLAGCQQPSGNNPGTTVVSNAPAGMVVIGGQPLGSLNLKQAAAGWLPQDSGYLTWNYDPSLTGSGATALTAGAITLIRVNVRTTMTVTSVVAGIKTAGSGLTSGQCFAGLYSSSGTLIAATADQASNWGTGTGIKTMALAGGPYTLAPGYYWVALVANGTTPPVFFYNQNSNAALANAGTSVSAARWAANGTGTTLPPAITPASNTLSQITLWAALS